MTAPALPQPRRSVLVSRLGLVAWSAFLAGTAWFLHAIGTGSFAAPPLLSPGRLADWPDEVGGADAIVAVLRLVALGLTWYLIAATVLGTVVRVGRFEPARGATDRVTPAFVKNLLGSATALSAAGLSLAVSPLLAPQGASSALSADAVAEPVTSTETVDEASIDDATGTDDASAPAVLAPSAGPAVLAEIEPAILAEIVPPRPAIDLGLVLPIDTWTVETGDHLWSIAEQTLAEQWGRTPSESEITRYWTRIIDANEHTLVAPDNPDLIYPGQTMVLPPVDAGD